MIAKEAFDLFTARYEWKNPIRSLTVRAINLVSTDYADQLNIFCDSEKMDRRERLDQVIEDIRRRFGKSIICNACLLNNPKMPPDCETKVIMPTGVPS